MSKELEKNRELIFRKKAKLKKMTQTELAEVLGVSPAEFFADDSDLFNISGIFPVRRRLVPMLGEIAFGVPVYAEEQKECYALMDEELEADFCLRAKGDSMIGARIHDGDVVFVRSQPMVENGEIGVVVIEDEATLKRVYYYPDKQKLILVPENKAYEPLVYLGDELETIRILGKAVAFQSKI